MSDVCKCSCHTKFKSYHSLMFGEMIYCDCNLPHGNSALCLTGWKPVSINIQDLLNEEKPPKTADFI